MIITKKAKHILMSNRESKNKVYSAFTTHKNLDTIKEEYPLVKEEVFEDIIKDNTIENIDFNDKPKRKSKKVNNDTEKILTDE